MSLRKIKKVLKYSHHDNTKKHFTDKLVSILKEPIYKSICELYKEIKEVNKNDARKSVQGFQKQMKNVKKWDDEVFRKYALLIMSNAKAKQKFMEKLLKCVIISNIKAMTSVGTLSNSPHLQPNVPSLGNFLSECLIIIGKEFFLQPHFICSTDKSFKRLALIKEACMIIEGCIRRTIEKFLPYEELMDFYIENIDKDDEESDDEMIDDDESVGGDMSDIDYSDVEDSDIEDDMPQEQMMEPEQMMPEEYDDVKPTFGVIEDDDAPKMVESTDAFADDESDDMESEMVGGESSHVPEPVDLANIVVEEIDEDVVDELNFIPTFDQSRHASEDEAEPQKSHDDSDDSGDDEDIKFIKLGSIDKL